MIDAFYFFVWNMIYLHIVRFFFTFVIDFDFSFYWISAVLDRFYYAKVFTFVYYFNVNIYYTYILLYSFSLHLWCVFTIFHIRFRSKQSTSINQFLTPLLFYHFYSIKCHDHYFLCRLCLDYYNYLVILT